MSQKKTSLILLAGGLGLRMETSCPKQCLPLNGKPIALHSYNVFLSIEEITEIIVVCAEEYTPLFPQAKAFAPPGKERQDSVSNGFKMCSKNSDFILIHDSVRPFITKLAVKNLLNEGMKTSAATLGVPVTSTIKQVDKDNLVTLTPSRSTLFEIQTPQLLKREVLQKGLEYAEKTNLTLTDDVALAELINHPVKIVKGSYSNIKITTKEDLIPYEKI